VLKSLNYKLLRESYSSRKLKCKTTEDLEPLEGIIGQDRAVKALKFGLNIENGGFNIFVAGYSGTGRTTSVKEFVEEFASAKPVPPDWCYVNNFKDSYQPNAIKLPSGRGKEFREDIKNLIASIRTMLPKTFESKDYTDKRDSIIKNTELQKDKILGDLNKRAKDEGFVLKSTQIGVFIVPFIDGKILDDQEFMSLPQEKIEEIRSKREKVNDDLKITTEIVRNLDKVLAEDLKKLNYDVALFTIEKSVNDIKEQYKDTAEVVEFVENVKEDILKNIDVFITGGGSETAGAQLVFPWMKEMPFKKYEVNLMVDNSGMKGAPVIIEKNPTYQNLFGRIEKEAQFGVLTTDFTMIRGGSIHSANGGFLVIPADELLKNFFSWDNLKMSITDKKIIIEEASEKLGYISTKGLKPEPIPLNIKVVLIGNPSYYYLLYSLDEDFRKLFKIKADFDMEMEKSDVNIKKYAAFICTLCKKENLRHLDAESVVKILEYSSRLAENKNKLSTRFSDISDLIFESNFYALQENSKYIKPGHILRAMEEKVYRSNLTAEKIKQLIADGTIIIDMEGEKIGQVNGLSVISLGDYTFGRPSRVTVSIGAGKDGIIDIERETKLGGPIHTKGVLILGGYLTEKFSKDKPLNISARIVFEQSYGGIEGDSASSAELYSMLSALSGAPLKQNIAVTGSVDQKGRVQAIGGVNEKIEGFFEICKIRGLDGSQGVVIPESNVKNLMLRDEVVDAVRNHKFSIFAVKKIDEGIEILTGLKAGTCRSDGTFDEGSVYYKIDSRLKELAEKAEKIENKKI
jgi:lon-related putative ATP-dependent protease